MAEKPKTIAPKHQVLARKPDRRTKTQKIPRGGGRGLSLKGGLIRLFKYPPSPPFTGTPGF